MLDKMERIEDPSITFADADALTLRFPQPGPLRKAELVRVDNASFGYDGRSELFSGCTVRMDSKSRVGILGVTTKK